MISNVIYTSAHRQNRSYNPSIILFGPNLHAIVRSCFLFCMTQLFRKITDDIYKYETKLEKLRSELDGQNLKLDHFQKIFTDVQILHERNSEAFQMLQDSG